MATVTSVPEDGQYVRESCCVVAWFEASAGERLSTSRFVEYESAFGAQAGDFGEVL